MEPQRTHRPWLWFVVGAVLAGSTVFGIMRQRETRRQFGPNIRYMKVGSDGGRGYVVTGDGRLLWVIGLNAREVPLGPKVQAATLTDAQVRAATIPPPPPGFTLDDPNDLLATPRGKP